MIHNTPLKLFIGILLCTVLFNHQSTSAQEKAGRFSVNVGATGVFIRQIEDFGYEGFIHPDLDVLYHIPISENTNLAGGLSLKISEYYQRENEGHLTSTGDIYKGYSKWNIKYKALGIPFVINTALEDLFFETLKAGLTISWIWDNKLTNGHKPVPSEAEINRFFVDLELGLQKDIYSFKKFKIGLTPAVGYRSFLGNNNDWQKGHWLFKLSINLTT